MNGRLIGTSSRALAGVVGELRGRQRIVDPASLYFSRFFSFVVFFFCPVFLFFLVYVIRERASADVIELDVRSVSCNAVSVVLILTRKCFERY